MSKMMDEKTRKELKGILDGLPGPVKLVFFTQEYPCPMCREQQSLLEDVAALSDKIKLEQFDFVLDGDMAMKYGVDKIPATCVVSSRDHGIRFYGLTSGYEFTSLLEAILMVSSGKSGLSPELDSLLRTLDRKVHIQVMVTLTCPYCPKAVHGAHQLAMASPHITADMVEAGEFPQLAKKYNVEGVPRTVINEYHYVEGQLPVEALFLEILKAVKPEQFKRLQDDVRQAQGSRKVRQARPGHHYELIIIGGGPAALSAAIYAARKELDVLLVTKDIGGQISYTASVENYLGFPQIGGKEMAEAFRIHAEHYPIAEFLGETVTKVDKKEDHFHVETNDGTKFTSHSVILCTGKEYRKLGVPNEEPFIGHGIAFCATCDAPLFKGKKVAVVGGGNSAFTAVRDLIDFASEIHLLHRRDKFTADPHLVEKAINADNVSIHKNTIVKEIIGADRLEGFRTKSTDGGGEQEFKVDGIFLEIGLTPNSKPVSKLLKLNERGEIPVICNNATMVEGLFAAGDVTDIPEKQISIAVGDGAKAALSAHKYLLSRELTHSRVAVGESWQ